MAVRAEAPVCLQGHEPARGAAYRGGPHPVVADLSDPEMKRLGKTLKQWREAFLAYFDTGRANNGGTEAINGLIELHRRVARGFRNREHYRLRMLLIGGGLNHPPQIGRAVIHARHRSSWNG